MKEWFERYRQKRRSWKERERQKPLWLRLLRSVIRMAFFTTVLLGSFYLWQPQKIDWRPTPVPSLNSRSELTSGELFAKGTKVVVVLAHPDDAEFYVSGTLLNLHKAGAKVTVVLTTDGDKGYYPFFLTNAPENRRIRREEQRLASSRYGAEVIFLGGPDGRYSGDEQALASLETALQKLQPEFLITFDWIYPPKIQHRDHLETGRVAHEVGKSIPSLRWILATSTRARNFFVDTSDNWEIRSELLAIHKSQFFGDKLERIRGFVLSKAIDDGERSGTEFAEGFRAVRMNGKR